MSDEVVEFKKEQDKLLDIIRADPSHINYWNVYKKLKKKIVAREQIKNIHDFKIALLSSFTIDPLQAYLDIDCRLLGLKPHIYQPGFNQYHQEIINDTSGLHTHDPELTLFFIQLESLLDDNFLVDFPKLSTDHKSEIINDVFQRLTDIIKLLIQKTSSLILFSNFVVPLFSPLGIMDNKQEIGLKRFYQIINEKLEKLSHSQTQLFILDLDGVVANFGRSEYINYPMYYRGSFLFTENLLSKISNEVISYVKPLKGKNKKAIVLDLDNTIWGGIIGEDGLEGIKLNNNYPGNEFVHFQKIILSLHNRGIILALNSKNDESYALEAFKTHPFMVLKEENIASYRINWQDKASNIVEIAQELNIGLDSLIFLDDNPVERERVRTSVPEVLVPELPKSPALYVKLLQSLNDFNNLTFTTEDLKRGEMYLARKKRKDIEKNVQTMDDFIQNLEIVLKVKQTNKFSLPRVSSLINKTNQFNLTTKRFTEAEVDSYLHSQDKIVYDIQVRDKYGDEGIVGASIINKLSERSVWKIDVLLMSCRVIGRKIETAFLTKIFRDAKKENISEIQGEYIPTKKNGLVKNLYKDHGFQMVQENPDGSSLWRKEITQDDLNYPQYLTVEEV